MNENKCLSCKHFEILHNNRNTLETCFQSGLRGHEHQRIGMLAAVSWSMPGECNKGAKWEAKS